MKENKAINWPNLLTLTRIFLIPLFVIVFYLPVRWSHLATALIFALASFTDWLDGYLARYLKQSTQLGAFLDPVADKLIVSIALVLIVAEPTFQFISLPSAIMVLPSAVIAVPAAIIVARELLVSALREWMAELGNKKTLAVSRIAKIKTTVQMGALVILLYCNHTDYTTLVLVGYLLLYLAAFLTVWSMLLYLKIAWKQLRNA